MNTWGPTNKRRPTTVKVIMNHKMGLEVYSSRDRKLQTLGSFSNISESQRGNHELKNMTMILILETIL